MTDIATTLTNTEIALATLRQTAAAAQAGGEAKAKAADAAKRAVAALEAAEAQAQWQRDQLLARDARVSAALAARAPILAAADQARTQGDKPLADTSATALRTAVAAAAGTTPTKLDSDGVKAVTDLDEANAALDDTPQSELDAALQEVTAKEAALAAKIKLAEAALARAESSPTSLDMALTTALATHARATRLAAAGTASGPEAVVAYADYQGSRATLTAAIPASAANQIQTDWSTARDDALSALADLLAARTTAAQRRLALETALADQAAKAMTRDADAAAAVAAALAPPPPPPGP